MRWRFGTLALLTLYGLGDRVLAAERPDVKAAIVAPQRLPAGARTTVFVEMTIGPGWHVNSHLPADKFLIPTDVSLASTQGELSATRYPPGVERRPVFAEKSMLVYEGTVRFEADLVLPANATGTASISGVVAFQACNDRQCFPPAKISLAADVDVSAAGKPGASR